MWTPLAIVALLLANGSDPVTVTEEYVILRSYSTQSESDNGSSGSSSGRSAWSETVDRVSDRCVEKTFDSIDGAGQIRPLAAWKFPVRVRQCTGTDPVIVNEDEMIARLERFLDAVKITRESCERYYFTWNVFQIDCDPEVALDFVEDIYLGAARIVSDAQYVMPDKAGSAILAGLGGDNTFVGTGKIDPAFLRNQAAQAIVVLAELEGEVVSDEDALAQLKDHQFHGEFTVEFEIDRLAGKITRTLTTESRSVDAEGVTETRKAKETTTRQRAESANGPDPSLI